MPNETPDVPADSSPAQDVNADSSTAAPAEATANQAEPEEQRVPLSRLKEVTDEKNYWREQAMLNAQRAQQAQPVQAESSDPYAGMDAQTKVFWQEVDRRNEIKIKAAKEEARREYQAGFETLASQSAKIQEKLFRTEEKDVQPGSPEERRIADLIRVGLDPEEAAWAVMGKKRVESAGTVRQAQKQVKTQEKAQASLDTTSLPTHHGVPTQEKLSFREKLSRNMQAAGL